MGLRWLGIAGAACVSAWGSPTLDSVEKLSKGLGAKVSLEHVLTAIGEKYPELRENFILMHESKSRQKASYRYPRVIAFTPDARFTLAFNGDPKAEGFNELEMYEFSPEATEINPKAESFKFRRIIFEPAPDYPFLAHEPREPEYPAYKPLNEQLCRDCHGQSSLRPNWESYNLWEGAFFRTDVRHQGEKYALPYQSDDHKGFDDFYTKQANKGRYKFLVGVEDQYVYPLKTKKRIPTSEFAQQAGYLNYRRIAHLIRETPDYDQYKYAALGALYDCENFDKLLPKDSLRVEKLADYIDMVGKSYSRDANVYHLKGDESKMAKFFFLFRERGISTAKWSMSRRRSPYSFVTPGGSPEGFISHAMMELDPSLDKFRVWRTSVDDRYYGVMSDFVKTWTGRMEDMTGPACKDLEAAVLSFR